VYYDHQKFEESMCLMSNWELFLQEMPENWPQHTAEDTLPELVLFVRKLSPSELTIGPFEEVELPSTSGQELNAKVAFAFETKILANFFYAVVRDERNPCRGN
jgi:Ubiquitin carboxyl-terminal hydrolase 47 C-terminal